ncbi:MAG TPA: hypothetical protein PKZ76_11685 [Xanthomonadaceae bacterium]|nr:hypothetical protein [Xanthomonadaceae bacterium]
MRRQRTGIQQRRLLGPALLLAGLVFLLLALLGALPSPWSGARSHAPGVLVPDAPHQELVKDATPIRHGDFVLTPRAEFRFEARVILSSIYRFDTGAALAPVDLALGWQRMSDSAVLDHFRVSQGGRWWRWRVDTFPIPEREIIASAANMHMIPADRSIERTLRGIRRGDLVEIEGLLVDARRESDGWTWRTSLSRTDSGDGACELVYVESIVIH